MHYCRILSLLLFVTTHGYSSPTPRSAGQKTSWTQEKAVLVHSSSTNSEKAKSGHDTEDSVGSDSDSLLSFASAYDIQKSPLPVLASRVSDDGPEQTPSEADYQWTPYESPPQHHHATRRVDSYDNIPISDGIPSKIYSTPTPVITNRGYLNIGQSSASPPTLLYGTPSPTPVYGSPNVVHHSTGGYDNGHDSYGPPPSYGPGPAEDEEIRFVIHKEGDESLVKQTLSEKAQWANEHVKFVKGPQLQIEQHQKVYLPPKPKMVVYILLKEPKVHTHVHVEGEKEEMPKPEVYIMYERTNGVEKTHYDLGKDKDAGIGSPGSIGHSTFGGGDSYSNNYNTNFHKRDTLINKEESPSSTESISSHSDSDSSAEGSKDEPKTSSSNQESVVVQNPNLVVRKPKVVCTATM